MNLGLNSALQLSKDCAKYRTALAQTQDTEWPVVTTRDIAPIACVDHVFSGATRISNTSNFATDTVFNSIEFTDNSFVLSGNRVALTDSIVQAVGATHSTVALGIRNNGALEIDAAGTSSVSGVISGTVLLKRPDPARSF